MRKPDGLVVVPAGGEAAFLAPLPIRRLWGVGPKMEETLLRLGVHTIGDLSRLEPARLERRLGTHGRDLLLLASGIDDRPVLADRGEAKSLGQETTFDADVGDVTKLRQTLLELADGVARRLRAHSLSGRTVTLKYRDEDFRTLTRAATLERPTDAGDIVFSVAWGLFGKAHGARRVRLLGIYVSGFAGRAQRDMFTEEPAAADRLRDAVARRFGDAALVRATLIPRPGEPPRAALDGAGSRRRRS
jgi:DNA polymerase-4